MRRSFIESRRDSSSLRSSEWQVMGLDLNTVHFCVPIKKQSEWTDAPAEHRDLSTQVEMTFKFGYLFFKFPLIDRMKYHWQNQVNNQ